MRDLDALLADRGNPRPHKPLQAGFTKSIIERIEAHPRPAGPLARLKERLAMKFHKPAAAFAAAAITVVISGTAFAAFKWPTITSVFSGETRLPNGNRVVAVGTENCQYFGKPDPKATNKETIYYELRKDSSLSNEEVVDMIKGVCEENRAYDAVNEVIEPFLKTGDRIMSGSTSRIQAVEGNKITLLLDSQFDPMIHYLTPVTYTINKDVKVYDGTRPIDLADLKAEDSIILIVRDNHGQGDDPSPWDDPDLLDVLAVVKVPPLTGSPDTFYTRLGKDFVRTEPCDTDPSGFCRAYDFDK